MKFEQSLISSPEHDLASFLEEWRASGGEALDVSVVLTRKKELQLERVKVNPGAQGQGMGSQFLSALAGFADRQRLPVVIHQVGGMAGQTADTVDELVQWYQKFGFQVTNTYGGKVWPAMRREPTDVEQN